MYNTIIHFWVLLTAIYSIIFITELKQEFHKQTKKEMFLNQQVYTLLSNCFSQFNIRYFIYEIKIPVFKCYSLPDFPK